MFERELKIDRMNIGEVGIILVSSDHIPTKRPIAPWGTIENLIKESSLIFAEYFSPDLDRHAFTSPIFGKIALESAERNGIIDFSQKIENLTAKYNKQVTVADIANKGMFEVYHYLEQMGIFCLGLLMGGLPRDYVPTSTVLATLTAALKLKLDS